MEKTATFKIVDFGSLKALASVTIDGMEIRGFKILEQGNPPDIWVAMPSREVVRLGGGKEYFDIVRFVGEDADLKKKEFNNWFLEEYRKAAGEEAKSVGLAALPKETKPTKKPRKSKKAVAGPEPTTKEE